MAASAITSAQPHGGLIRKREEPYSSLIRARPREKKLMHDRLIVLGDADPNNVEERLGSALISNEVFDKLKDQAKDRKGASGRAIYGYNPSQRQLISQNEVRLR